MYNPVTPMRRGFFMGGSKLDSENERMGYSGRFWLYSKTHVYQQHDVNIKIQYEPCGIACRVFSGLFCSIVTLKQLYEYEKTADISNAKNRKGIYYVTVYALFNRRIRIWLKTFKTS